MAYVLYGSETDGPYLVQVDADKAEAFAGEVHGHVFETADDARDAWEGRGTEPLGPGVGDAPAPSGEAPAADLGSGDPAAPQGATEAPTMATQTPAESSPSADQS